MVLPQEIGDAAQDADTDRVIAWLDAGGSINDTDFQGYTLVNCCAAGGIDKRLVAGVRKYGTYKRYMRAPHRDVLAVRGLAQRENMSTRDPVLNFLARLGDNGVCWHILSFWRATN